MGMTREGRASSARSKNSSSILAALREKIEKLAPPGSQRSPHWRATASRGNGQWNLRNGLRFVSRHGIAAFLPRRALDLALAQRFDLSVKSRSHSKAVVDNISSVKRQRQFPSARPGTFIRASDAEVENIL